MGNNQSNERQQNWKIFKITSKEIHDGWMRFFLDGYVTYRNGSYKNIDFDKVFFLTRLQFLDFQEGTYVKIDLEKTRYENNTHNFHVVLDGVIDKVKVSNISETAANLGEIGEAIEARRQFVASIEQSRYAENHAWTKQTSWDMPHGWK